MTQKHIINIPEIEKHYRIEEDGAVFSITKNRYLRSVPNSAGYLHVCLHLYKANTFFLVHRLVAAKYIGECPIGQETSHRDGNRQNNLYTNLEYLTHSQNQQKAYREHGRVSYLSLVPHPPVSYLTKQKMSEAKKKPVLVSYSGTQIIYPSIEDAAKSLNTYRKAIYRAIKENTPLQSKSPFKGAVISFYKP